MLRLTVVGELTRGRSRAYDAKGEMQLPDGTILVQVSGLYVRIPGEMVEEDKFALAF